MRRTLWLVLIVALFACSDKKDKVEHVEARTIENSPVAVVPVEPPPTVDEEIAPVVPSNLPDEEKERIAALGQQVDLPFAPAIAMDPVDGSKVSIRTNTPTVEYKKHVYYFSSAATKAQFMANPDQYTKGSLAKYQ